MLFRALLCAALLVAASCTPAHAYSEDEFRHWLSADTSCAEAFANFEAMLQSEGVSGVVPDYQLWRVDQLEPRCAAAQFLAPPRAVWPNIVPALRFIRDHVKPEIGALEVVSGYRDPTFNTCLNGAPASAHRGFYALDLIPTDSAISRDALIARLCPIHAAQGPGAHVGLGIYTRARFHIDARGFRGWGADHYRATFPCDNARRPS